MYYYFHFIDKLTDTSGTYTYRPEWNKKKNENMINLGFKHNTVWSQKPYCHLKHTTFIRYICVSLYWKVMHLKLVHKSFLKISFNLWYLPLSILLHLCKFFLYLMFRWSFSFPDSLVWLTCLYFVSLKQLFNKCITIFYHCYFSGI